MPPQKPLSSFYLSLTPDMTGYLRKKLQTKYRVNISKKTIDSEMTDPNTELLGVFVDSKVTKKVLDALPKLKLIVTLSTGYDHIDLKEAKKRNIVVCNVPSYGENTVAEFALGLMLSISRQLFQAIRRVKGGVYDYHGLRGFDIKGKTIGVIGTGKIGIRFIEMLQGLHANIIAYDAFPKKEFQKQYGFQYVPLGTLWKESDIISLHVPLLKETKHIVNKAAIKKMKKGVVLINTARGGLIDSEALVWGLENNLVGGAGLDVLEEEDLLEDTLKLFQSDCSAKDTRISLMNNILIDHPRTMITPHTAFNTTEAIRRIIDTTVENIKAFLKDEPTHNVIR
jgi:D-lactate dehydrogenase